MKSEVGKNGNATGATVIVSDIWVAARRAEGGWATQERRFTPTGFILPQYRPQCYLVEVVLSRKERFIPLSPETQVGTPTRHPAAG